MSSKIVDWCAETAVSLCVLFGSQATGKAPPNSDLDLAVWPSAPIKPMIKLTLINGLELLLNKPISLVIVSRDTNPTLGFEIAKNGRLLYETEPHLWTTQRIRLWQAYTDAAPFRQLLRQQLIARAKETA